MFGLPWRPRQNPVDGSYTCSISGFGLLSWIRRSRPAVPWGLRFRSYRPRTPCKLGAIWQADQAELTMPIYNLEQIREEFVTPKHSTAFGRLVTGQHIEVGVL